MDLFAKRSHNFGGYSQTSYSIYLFALQYFIRKGAAVADLPGAQVVGSAGRGDGKRPRVAVKETLLDGVVADVRTGPMGFFGGRRC